MYELSVKKLQNKFCLYNFLFDFLIKRQKFVFQDAFGFSPFIIAKWWKSRYKPHYPEYNHLISFIGCINLDHRKKERTNLF